MKWKHLGLLWSLVGILCLTGCDGGGGPTGPSNAPVLSNIRVNPSQVNQGTGVTIVFSIDFVDIPGDLNGGPVVITDSQGNRYESVVSDAVGTAGTLITSIQLSQWVPPGEVLLTIYVWDLAGNQSNPGYVTITVI
jgi:hypothetical protein